MQATIELKLNDFEEKCQDLLIHGFLSCKLFSWRINCGNLYTLTWCTSQNFRATKKGPVTEKRSLGTNALTNRCNWSYATGDEEVSNLAHETSQKGFKKLTLFPYSNEIRVRINARWHWYQAKCTYVTRSMLKDNGIVKKVLVATYIAEVCLLMRLKMRWTRDIDLEIWFPFW